MPVEPGYWGPVNETASDIFLERTFMQAGYLTGVAYGIQFVLYLACMRILWKGNRTKFTYFLLFYLSFLNILNLIWAATSAYGLQITYIDYRNYPGGPIGFLGVEFSLPVNTLSLTAYIVQNILADALLLWRCRVIWAASLGVIGDYLMIFPLLMLLASAAMGIAFDIEDASPSGLYGSTTVSFATPYFAISLSLNIILTLMIAGRIWSYQRRIKATIGGEYGKHYTSITTMFIESAAIYSVTSILLLATFIPNNPINQIWLGIAPGVQLITSYLIIYRVAEGRAWSKETLTKTTNDSTVVLRRPGYFGARSGTKTDDSTPTTAADFQFTTLKTKSSITDTKETVHVVREEHIV